MVTYIISWWKFGLHVPHPSDVYDIYNLRQLRNDLRVVPQVPKLYLIFLENNIATWFFPNGISRHRLDINRASEGGWGWWETDVGYILSHFSRLTNISEAHIFLPDSLLRDGQNMEMRQMAQDTEECMMNIQRLEEDPDNGPTADDFMEGMIDPNPHSDL
jgi:hypothetical protein